MNLQEQITEATKKFTERYGDKAVWQVDTLILQFANEIKDITLNRFKDVLSNVLEVPNL